MQKYKNNWLKGFSVQEEEGFFIELQEKYLKPLEDNKETRLKSQNDLRELRNKVCPWSGTMEQMFLVTTSNSC